MKEITNDPYLNFELWFKKAVVSEPQLPEAVALATATPEGMPSCRIVLFKGFDQTGERFLFFTNYESDKSKQLLANPKAALTFYWKSLDRQIRVEGIVAKTNREVSEAYWQTRPRGSQIGAMASQQSQPIASHEELIQAAKQKEQKFLNREIPCPEYWGGFYLDPQRFEFWQSMPDRLHQRVVYTKKQTKWVQSFLAP